MSLLGRSLLVALVLCVIPVAWSQDQEADQEQVTAPNEAAASTDDDAADDQPDSGVLETDDESYIDIDQKDFRPSEELPVDQSISFPTDI